MTFQEVIYKDKILLVHGMMSFGGKVHPHVRKFVGKTGVCLGEAKNGMLLIKFPQKNSPVRAIPTGCCTILDNVDFAKKKFPK